MFWSVGGLSVISSSHLTCDSRNRIFFLMTDNLLIQAMVEVQTRVVTLKSQTKDFYFDVLMSLYPCPRCGGRMRMSGASRAQCACGVSLDPTIEFQRSECCSERLKKRVFHYVCSHCGEIVPSRFLFDERLFDADYFRLAVAESRERKSQRREELRLLLSQSHSDELPIMETPELERIPGLMEAITDLLDYGAVRSDEHMPVRSDFRIEDYRALILAALGDAVVAFDTIPTLDDDERLDRARRFTTLIFMEHAREIWLEQHGAEILVVPYEAHN